MKPPYRRGQTRSLRRSFTLVEVVASLALLGGTVVALLAAQSRAMRQVVASRHRQQAARLAQELISHWRLDGQPIATHETGTFVGLAGWSWTRTPLPPQPGDPEGVLRLRIEIVRWDADHGAETVTILEWLEASIEGADPNVRTTLSD